MYVVHFRCGGAGDSRDTMGKSWALLWVGEFDRALLSSDHLCTVRGRLKKSLAASFSHPRAGASKSDREAVRWRAI